MSQKQFHRFQSDVKSFELGEALVGLFRPGRFSGFNEMTSTPNGDDLDIVISHTGGVKKGSKENPPVLSDPLGVVITTQGQVIHETSDVALTVPDGAKAAQKYRCDVVYMEHEYEEITGPTPVIYGVVTGSPPPSSTEPQVSIPDLSHPNKQVVIGYIYYDQNNDPNWIPRNSGDGLGDSSLFSKLISDDVSYMVERVKDNSPKPLIGHFLSQETVPLISKNNNVIENLKVLANYLDNFVNSFNSSDVSEWVDIKPYLTFGDVLESDEVHTRRVMARRSGSSIEVYFEGRAKVLYGSYANNIIQVTPGEEQNLSSLLNTIGISTSSGNNQVRVPLKSNSMVLRNTSNLLSDPLASGSMHRICVFELNTDNPHSFTLNILSSGQVSNGDDGDNHMISYIQAPLIPYSWD